MKAIVLKCRPGSRFHFGKYAPDADTALNDSDEIMRSDTLFAGLVNGYQQIFGNAQPLVDMFTAGHINISSLLYCFQQQERYIWLLPKPACFDVFDGGDQSKIYKNVKWLSKALWETLQHPTDLLQAGQVILAAHNTIALLSGELQLKQGAGEKEYYQLRCGQLVTLPKVLVRENPKDKTIYQLTVNEIAGNSEWAEELDVHYYFLLQTSPNASADILANLQKVIELLPWQGIGAERSTIGRVEAIEEIPDWQLQVTNAHADYAATVSLFAPQPAELGNLLYYRGLMRGGRRLGPNDNDEKKNKYLKSVRMVQEGAVVNISSQGRLADVSPLTDASFLRHGRAFCLPITQIWIPTL